MTDLHLFEQGFFANFSLAVDLSFMIVKMLTYLLARFPTQTITLRLFVSVLNATDMRPITEGDTSPSEADGNVILYLLFRRKYGVFFIFSDDDDDDEGMLYIGSPRIFC